MGENLLALRHCGKDHPRDYMITYQTGREDDPLVDFVVCKSCFEKKMEFNHPAALVKKVEYHER